MTLQQLRYVIEIVNCGSMNAAAEKLFVTQPSLSNAVKELEKELQDLTDKRCKDIDELTVKKAQELMAV